MKLPARIHYDEDWNLKVIATTFLLFFFQPVSIMMRIETLREKIRSGASASSSPYPLWWGLKPDTLEILLPIPVLPARIHYDEDWNPSAPGANSSPAHFQPVSIMMRIETVGFFQFELGLGASSPYPLWWGLKPVLISANASFCCFQPVSIMMRIETWCS